jgi:predicted dehydrogenase
MTTITRRNCLKTSVLLGGSMFLPRLAMGKSGPTANLKLNIALIGSGGIAETAFGDCKGHNVVAIADVDDVRGAPGFKVFPDAKRYKDFRKLLDAHAKELDLVIVSTPDHTHFAATYAAMERGIAVHTQKPLTHNIWQARTLKAAAEKFKVQTVMGNQGHNFEGMRMIRDWYDAGLIGKVREVHAWTNRTTTNTSNSKIKLPAEPVPSTLDWDLWTGPAVIGAYNKKFCPAGWRWWWDYGLGGLGDIGCHTLDIPIYVLGLGYPTLVYMDNTVNFRSKFDSKKPNKDAATYVYEFAARGDKPPVKVFWYEGGHLPDFPDSMKNAEPDLEGGCIIVGEKNTIFSPGMRPTSPRFLNDWVELRKALPPKTTPRAVGSPVEEIIAAIRGEIQKAGSHFDYAVPLTETVILGTIANRSGKKVEYLPESMTFKDSSLNHFVKESVRKGWEYGEDLLKL